MQRDRFVVVDVHYVVDLGLEWAGVQTGRRQELVALLALLGRTAVLDDEVVRIRPVLSEHIYQTALNVLSRTLSTQEATRALLAASKTILAQAGVFDSTHEDYNELSRRCWARLGTDAEDEAILACAERHHASVVTRDADFAQYLGDRKVAHWTATELVSASTVNS